LTHPAVLHALVWGEKGSGRAVLVHGSVSGAEATWSRQRPLGARFRVVAPDRRGYGLSPAVAREDFDVDAIDVGALLGGGAHLAGHSYGGVVALLAAARRPEAVRSLCLLEPPAYAVARGHPAVERLRAEQAALFAAGPGMSDEDFLAGFIASVGGDPGRVPRPLTPLLAQHTGLLRRFRPPWEAEPDLPALAGAGFPVLVVSGGHHPGFEAVCDALAEGLRGARETIAGAQHNIPRMGEALNRRLDALWAGARTT
jgi:pimeloyl-ACP methyl ester carboxylesterase